MKLHLTKTTRFAFLVVFYLTHNLLIGQTQIAANQPSQTSTLQQRNSELSQNSNTENQSPFEAVKGKREDLKKRDLYSKHYINGDGSFTALIGAGPIHYEKNGQFLDINHTIEPQMDVQFPYANTTNLFSSHFGATAHTGVKNKTAEGEIKEFLNTKMYWEVNGQAINTHNSANKTIRIDGEKAYYDNIYGNISAEFTTLTGKRKLNYIIPNQQALGNIPSGVDFLVFTEDVILPFGWTSSTTETGIMIKDQLGKEIYLYENPVSTDAESHELREENTIFEILQIGNTITIKTKVKTDWLLSNERAFPVMVDPTTDYYPNQTTHRTGQTFSSGGGFGNIAVGYAGGYYRGFASFDTNSIHDLSTINSVVLYHRVYGGQYMSTGSDGGTRGSEIRSFLTDPSSYGSNWQNLYNAITNTAVSPGFYVEVLNIGTNGWKNVTLGATANQDLKNNLSSNFFAIGYRPRGNYNTTTRNEYALIYGEDAGNNKPYIRVNYTESSNPPTCVITPNPADGSNGAAHQGNLSWNAVAGATSYDVYFGSSATPTLVSSGQTGTTYAITDCLLPLTTYYWQVIPKNASGSATGCAIWSFTTDNKLHIYKTDFENATDGYFATSGNSYDNWHANDTSGIFYSPYTYANVWTIGTSAYSVNGKSAGVTGLRNYGLYLSYFEYWTDLGLLYRWIYKPFDLSGLRDIELDFKWKAGGSLNEDFGSVATSINGGDNWMTEEQGGTNNDGKYSNSSMTQTQNIIFPSSRNNQNNFQLAFKWTELGNSDYGGDFTFVVDDILLRACPYEGEILSDEVNPGIYEWIAEGSTETTLTINGSHTCAYYEWEQSDDGTNWTVIPGATSTSYTTPNNLNVDTWYRSRVYFSSGCPGVYQEQPFKIILPDCPTSTTWNGTSWTNGAPNELTERIIFEGNFTSTLTNTDSGNLTGCSLEVLSGNVVISSGHSVTLDKEIKVSGGSFTLENEASLVQIQADAVNTGNITVKRNTTEMVKFDATYWSSPVSGQNLKEFSSATLNNRFYIYNGYNAAPEGISPHFKAVFVNDANYPMPPSIPEEWNVPTDELIGNLFRMDTYTFKPGWGYSIRVPNNWPHALGTEGGILSEEFDGVPHNGEVIVPAYGKYTMVGNPYPSPIQTMGAQGFFEANQDVGTLHFWTHHFNVTELPGYNTNYVTYTNLGSAGNQPGVTGEPIPNGIIAVAQGFVVENTNIAEEQSTQKWAVIFRNEMRTNESGVFFKGNHDENEKHRYWINLMNESDVQLAQILIGYTPEASYEVDHQIDGRRMGSAPLFSWIDENDYTVQGRPMPFEIEDIVPLGFVANLDGKYKLSLNAFDGFFRDEILRIYIRDNQTQEEHDLMSSDYWFEAVEGEYPNRFEVFYKVEEVLDNEEIDLNTIQIYHEGANIMVKSSREKILSVELWDISGRKLHQNQKVNSHLYSIPKSNFGTQVLLVTVMTEKGEITRKKIINY